MTRNTWEACVDFVLKECDSAILLLKGKMPALGRASDLAAMALRSRMLLYAASDLHGYTHCQIKIPGNQQLCQSGIVGLFERRPCCFGGPPPKTPQKH